MFFKFNQVFTKLRESIEEQSSVISILKEKTDQVREAGACLDCFSCKVWASFDLVCFIPSQRVETAHSTEHIDQAGISGVTCYTRTASLLLASDILLTTNIALFYTSGFIERENILSRKSFILIILFGLWF